MAHVLIVEDDSFLQRVYQDFLPADSYTLAVNGEDGLKKAKELKPDLILLDTVMPKMNGIQVLEQLKADHDTQQIPVVMLTNLSDAKDEETARSKGAVGYVVKSDYDPAQLMQVIQDLLKQHTKTA